MWVATILYSVYLRLFLSFRKSFNSCKYTDLPLWLCCSGFFMFLLLWHPSVLYYILKTKERYFSSSFYNYSKQYSLNSWYLLSSLDMNCPQDDSRGKAVFNYQSVFHLLWFITPWRIKTLFFSYLLLRKVILFEKCFCIFLFPC